MRDHCAAIILTVLGFTMYLHACITSRRIAVIAFCAFVLSIIPISAQEIEYDTVVRNTLGQELWAIPISGPLTISQDGSKLLVASVRDTTFYIVDVATGAYRPVNSAPDYSTREGGPFLTFYTTDAALTTLWVTQIDRTAGFVWNHYVIDLLSDSVLFRPGTGLEMAAHSISRLMDRASWGGILYRLSTLDTIAKVTTIVNSNPWFDDNHRKLYVSTPWQVDEVDPVTGKVEQTWAVNSEISYARRPANSDWLYVYNYCVDKQGGTCGDVNAINVLTQERVLFAEHNGDHPITPSVYLSNGATSTIGYCSRDAYGLGPQPIWSFDAAARKTATILNQVFYYNGQLTPKLSAITPDFSVYVHAWFDDSPDSSFTRCNQIVPLTTTVDRSMDSATTAAWLATSGEWMEIRIGDTEDITSVDLHTVRGQLVKHLDRTECLARPLRISLAMLLSGSYMCTVQTTQGTRSSSFTISK